MGTTYDLLQQTSCMYVWQTIPNSGEMFGGTGAAMPILLKNWPTPPITKSIVGTDVFPHYRILREVRTENYVLGGYVKVLTVWKAVSAVSKTIYIDSNKGIVPLKPINKTFIRPMEIVMDGFGEDYPPVRKKLPMVVYIPEWLLMKGLEKEAT